MNGITIHDYVESCQKECFLCGEPPSNPTKFPGTQSLDYNGVVRIDAALAFTTGNLVTLCKCCAGMKSDGTLIDAVRRARRIVKNLSDYYPD